MRSIIVAVACSLLVGSAVRADVPQGKVDPKRSPLPPGQVFDPHLDQQKRYELPESVTGSVLFYSFNARPIGPIASKPFGNYMTAQNIEANGVETTVIAPVGDLTTRTLRIVPTVKNGFGSARFSSKPFDLSKRKAIVAQWTGDLPDTGQVMFFLTTNEPETVAAVYAKNGKVGFFSTNPTTDFGSYAPGTTPATLRFDVNLDTKTFTASLTQKGKTVTSPPLPVAFKMPAGDSFLHFRVSFPDNSQGVDYKLVQLSVAAPYK